MSKRTSRPSANQPELVVRPYDNVRQSLIHSEHYALEYARLINEVHAAVFAEARQHITEEGMDDVVTRGVLILALNNPDTYEAIARNRGARKQLETIKNAATTINDALGLSYGLRIDGGNGGMFGVNLY